MTLEARFDTHEEICGIRYEELSTDIKELKESVKALTEAISMGSGAVKMIFIMGTIVASVWGVTKIVKGL